MKNLTGMRLLGWPSHSSEDISTMDLKEISVNMRNLIDQHRDYWRDLVNAALNLEVP